MTSTILDSTESDRSDTPLCVDLDGTLIRTDLLVEGAFRLLRKNLLYLFLLPFWLLKGKANLKEQIANRVIPEPTRLPFHPDFLAFLKQEHQRGRKLILATASDRRYGNAIANHLGIFNEVFGTEKGINLAGNGKKRLLVERFGDGGFAYAGDARVDHAIWQHASEIIVVNPRPGVLKMLKQAGHSIHQLFDEKPGSLKQWIKALRLHQWMKNILLFAPLVAGHRFLNPDDLLNTTIGFIAFSFCASSCYLLNDLTDLDADRCHPRKKHRPLAAGMIPMAKGVALIPILVIMGFTLSLLLPREFTEVLFTYYILTLLYSFHLKRIVLLDVLILAMLFTLRINAGGAILGVELTFWLQAFSMFLFLSLALVKRYTELLTMQKLEQNNTQRRGYQLPDISILLSLGSASGLMAVLVMALYINSARILDLYQYPKMIWLLCPLAVYWISHVWLVAGRDEMHDDPVLFAIKDPISLGIGATGLLILFMAT
ncbi:MAG: UbiA family prenyltransferase [Magnetococcales bacterium]|nr:UbiA family prenyltransferase [Magnetococcales bacterium]